MTKMKTDRCLSCGGIILKLTGGASKLCFDKCVKCRRKDIQESEPRRCATNIVGAAGECLACDAEQGVACQKAGSVTP